MSLIPDFEIGFWNAWIFMIWLILFPVITGNISKFKEVSKRITKSVPIKHEKKLNFISTSAFIFGFFYSIFLPIKFDNILFYFGLILYLIGFILTVGILNTLRNTKTNEPFTTGPYRYSRHPIYLSHMLLIFGITLIGISWIFLIIFILVTSHMFIVAPAEEKFCLKNFGDKYQKYIDKTPRWFGLPKSIKIK